MEADTRLIKTYRYLRLGMVVLVVMLLASVVIEIIEAGGCLRTSISSYYFTPARGVFIGALVAIGACLVVLKGNTPLTDVLLNIAGVLAAVVAFVPIADPGECASAAVGVTEVGANVFNNVTALSVAGFVALAVAIVLVRRESRDGGVQVPRQAVVGIAVTLGFGGLLLGLFLWARDFFEAWAHYIAAVPLFAILIVVMVLEGLSFGRATNDPDLTNRYSAIAATTVIAVAALIAAKFALGWEHGLFWIEVVVIVAFGVFWVVQTVELWSADQGLRSDPEGVVASGAP